MREHLTAEGGRRTPAVPLVMRVVCDRLDGPHGCPQRTQKRSWQRADRSYRGPFEPEGVDLPRPPVGAGRPRGGTEDTHE